MRCWRMYSAFEHCQLAAWYNPHCLTELVLTPMLLLGSVVYLMLPRHLLQLYLSSYQLSLQFYMMKQGTVLLRLIVHGV